MVDRNKYGAIQELAGHGVSKKHIARQLEVTIKTSNHFLARREVVFFDLGFLPERLEVFLKYQQCRSFSQGFIFAVQFFLKLFNGCCLFLQLFALCLADGSR